MAAFALALCVACPSRCGRALPPNRLVGTGAFTVTTAFAQRGTTTRTSRPSEVLVLSLLGEPLGCGRTPIQSVVILLASAPGAAIVEGVYEVPADAGSWAAVVPQADGGLYAVHEARGSVRLLELSRDRVQATFELEVTDPRDGGDEGHLLGTFAGGWDSGWDGGSCTFLIP